MNEDFVSYEIAKKLKEKGFKWNQITTYNPKTKVRNNHIEPTISQVLKWLREEKNLYCLPFFEQGVDLWLYAICKPACGSEFPEFISESDYDTYEQAALAGIEYSIDNLI